MAYSDFRYPQVLAQFGLTQANGELFVQVPPVAPSAALQTTLPRQAGLAALVNSEFSRAVWMIGPLLYDFWERFDGRIGLYAGVDFDVDADTGLNGYVDFLFTRTPQLPEPIAPAVVLFEAKEESIRGGFGQCIAGMVAVQRFNRAAGLDADPVYGCVTTGSLWRFLRLDGATVTFDLREYTVEPPDRLLGILTHIIGPVPAPAAA